MAALALPVGTDALATAAMAEGGVALGPRPPWPRAVALGPRLPCPRVLALWLCPSWPRTAALGPRPPWPRAAALGPRLPWTCPPWSLKVLWLLQFNFIAEIDDLAMHAYRLFSVSTDVLASVQYLHVLFGLSVYLFI